MKHATILLLILFVGQCQAQVLDVNGDTEVGAEEAIAVAEQWKGPASAANDHDHLGQTWIGHKNPLTIRGNFPDRPIIVPSKEGKKALETIPSAPLILDNTASYDAPDLILGGDLGTVSAIGAPDSSLNLVSRAGILMQLDPENVNSPTQLVVQSGGLNIAALGNDGHMQLLGNLFTANGTYKIDHPQSPSAKYLNHSNVGSPDMLNVYSGNVVLDGEGSGWVELPGYFEALNSDFRYTLTPIGGAAPNLHVAEKIENNQFMIAGGNPQQEISWQVTGIRQDAYAKANPIEVEQEKVGDEKGKYLHPEPFGEPVSRSVRLASPE